MDLSFIQEQLDNFATFIGAIEDLFNGLGSLFGTEGETDGGSFADLSSHLETSSEAEGEFEGSSEGEGNSESKASSENE